MSTLKVTNIKHTSSVDPSIILTSSGDTGIGSANPASKLDVSGEITLSSSPFLRNIPSISADYTVTTSFNEMSVGPITINTGVAVTVQSGATWTIV